MEGSTVLHIVSMGALLSQNLFVMIYINSVSGPHNLFVVKFSNSYLWPDNKFEVLAEEALTLDSI